MHGYFMVRNRSDINNFFVCVAFESVSTGFGSLLEDIRNGLVFLGLLSRHLLRVELCRS